MFRARRRFTCLTSTEGGWNWNGSLMELRSMVSQYQALCWSRYRNYQQCIEIDEFKMVNVLNFKQNLSAPHL